MAKEAEIAKQILSMLLGGAIGSMGGTAGILGGAGGILGGALGGSSGFGDDGYPKEFAPDKHHEYNVVHMPGKPNLNSYGKGYAQLIDEAGEMQSLKEHRDALTKYIRPGMTPKQLRVAEEMGLEEEKKLPKFWNESFDRRNFKVSSSAVSGIRITPSGNVEVRWGTSPKWYTFKQYGNTRDASLAAKELLKADSIGRAVYPVVSRHVKNPKNGLGEWNSKNYEAAYA